MSVRPADADQALCLECGLCCRGAWFEHVVLQQDEVERARVAGMCVADVNGAPAAMQPCASHRNGRCSTYGAWRPQACIDYRCKLLERVAAGEVSMPDAQALVRDMQAFAEQVRLEIGSDAGGLIRRTFLARMNDEASKSLGFAPLSASAKADVVALCLGYRAHFDPEVRRADKDEASNEKAPRMRGPRV